MLISILISLHVQLFSFSYILQVDYKHITFLLNIFIRVDVDTIIQATDKWCSIFSRAVQVEDEQVIEQVVYIILITHI